MVNMCNDRHVTDVMLHVHNTAELFSCELHHLGYFEKSNSSKRSIPVIAKMMQWLQTSTNHTTSQLNLYSGIDHQQTTI